MYQIRVKIHLNLVPQLRHDSPNYEQICNTTYPEFNPECGVILTLSTAIDLISSISSYGYYDLSRICESPLLSSESEFLLIQICRAAVNCNTV
jgi:hypothetical protein